MTGLRNLILKMSPLVRAIVFCGLATLLFAFFMGLPQGIRDGYYGSYNVSGADMMDRNAYAGIFGALMILNMLVAMTFAFLGAFLKRIRIFISLAAWIGFSCVICYFLAIICPLLGGSYYGYSFSPACLITVILVAVPWLIYCLVYRTVSSEE